jgi:hypothetical protein
MAASLYGSSAERAWADQNVMSCPCWAAPISDGSCVREPFGCRFHEPGQPLSWSDIGDDTFVPFPVMCGSRYDESMELRFPGGVTARRSRRTRRMIFM